MTTQQLHLFNALYLVLLFVVAVLTRATARRIAGALAGGAAAGLVALGIIALGEQVGWWHMAITWKPYFLTLAWSTSPCVRSSSSSPGGSPAGSAGADWRCS